MKRRASYDLSEFPQHHTDVLQEWFALVDRIEAKHGRLGPNDDSLSGRGNPYGPRRWDETGREGWRISTIRFYGKPHNNHGIGVDFYMMGLHIRAWGEYHIDVYIPSSKCDAANVREWLKFFAAKQGLIDRD